MEPFGTYLIRDLTISVCLARGNSVIVTVDGQPTIVQRVFWDGDRPGTIVTTRGTLYLSGGKTGQAYGPQRPAWTDAWWVRQTPESRATRPNLRTRLLRRRPAGSRVADH